jgi:hypothetical protein
MRPLQSILLGILLVASSLPSAHAAESATERGSVMLGGALSFSSVSGSGSHDQNILALAPRAMVFLANGFAIGAEAAFLRSSRGDYVSAVHRYLGELLFIAPLEARIRPYVQGGFGFIRSSGSYPSYYSYPPESGIFSYSENGWAVAVGVGAYAFLNEHYAIRAGINFDHDVLMISQGNNSSTNTFSLSIGFDGFVF